MKLYGRMNTHNLTILSWQLIVLYDDNNITIDGNTSLSFTEDVGKRFEAYGWQVLEVRVGIFLMLEN